ncbi:MAG: hypothetical protein JXA78_13280 [Anaerolineales bacterium]|nr:hypothetical protein [Anaerolineales bacterium]
MVLLGWLAGSTIVGLIPDFDHWAAMALLGYVGGLLLIGIGLHVLFSHLVG